jgi:hypothetical protein
MALDSKDTILKAKWNKAVETRALVFYRAILGGQGATRKRKDGTGDPAGTFAKGEGAIDDA